MKHQSMVLFLVSVSSLVAGCASETPYYDATFGQATERAKATQALQGERHGQPLQMGARELHNGVVNYMGDRPAPQAIQGVINGSRSGSGQ